MNEETNQLLREIRDLEREQVENQRKSLEYVRVQQKAVFKKLFIAFALAFALLFLVNIVK